MAPVPPKPPKNAGPVREAHRLEEARLDAWMKDHVEGYSGDLQVLQLKGGQSNPTYWLADREREYALRKKPPPRVGHAGRFPHPSGPGLPALLRQAGLEG